MKKLIIVILALSQVILTANSNVNALEKLLGLNETAQLDTHMSSHTSSMHKKKALSQDDIDAIFISFEEEKAAALEKEKMAKIRAEKLERERKERETRISKEASNMNIAGTPIFPKVDIEAEKRKIISGAYVKKKKRVKRESYIDSNVTKAKKLPNFFYGTSCVNGECVVFTPFGTLKTGDTVSHTKEKIKLIKPYFIKTNLREIIL